MINLPRIRLLTVPSNSAGQHLLVLITIDGREVEVIRTWGALPDISIDHVVTPFGIEAALATHLRPPLLSDQRLDPGGAPSGATAVVDHRHVLVRQP